MLKRYKFRGDICYVNSTLGNVTKILSTVPTIPKEIINNIFVFVKICNKFKH